MSLRKRAGSPRAHDRGMRDAGPVFEWEPTAGTRPRPRRRAWLLMLGCFLALVVDAGAMDFVRLGAHGTSFVLHPSGERFVPWGFNYDHDEPGRLIEDYWEDEWSRVEEDFREMKLLGANVVRIHLQFGRFMENPRSPDRAACRQLGRLIGLAQDVGLYLDLTGLGCYHKQAVPAWYDALSEKDRWAAQARFWEAVAETGKDSPAVFCYDLMNEPVVPGGNQPRADWLGPPFAGKHFVQFITLDRANRQRTDIARAWTRQLASAVRKHDTNHLVTVGLVDWSVDGPGLTSGFTPETLAPEVDFLCVHLYPERGNAGGALDTLKRFAVGKPLVIEETFPLRCDVEEFRGFMRGSKPWATGWMGFYWGTTPREYRSSTDIPAALMLGWLEFFQDEKARMLQAVE